MPALSLNKLRDHGQKRHSGPEKRVLVVAGEASGDLLGARLIDRLRIYCPGVSAYGIGGDAMQGSGVELGFHARELAVVGIVEILGRLGTIGRALRWIRRSLAHAPPDLVLLIDFPDFNLRVARHAANRGIPVVYYVSPQIWAWRRKRIRQIARYVTRMIVIFPFEEALYRKHGVPVTYVGHPLLDRFDPETIPSARERAYEEYGLSPLFPVLGLFPGSRSREVRVLLPCMIRAAEVLCERIPRLQVLLGKTPNLAEDVYREILAGSRLPVVSVRDGIGPGMAVCHMAVVASGTATLELALLGVPMVVVYRVSWPTFWLGRLLVHVPSISMVNLISRRPVVPELLQGELNERNLVASCYPFFTESPYYAHVKRELARVRGRLGEAGASDRAAQVVSEILGQS